MPALRAFLGSRSIVCFGLAVASGRALVWQRSSAVVECHHMQFAEVNARCKCTSSTAATARYSDRSDI
eukprot:10411-Heterococcus_DN1.PRE.1